MSDVPKIVAGLRAGQSFSAISVPEPPIIRKGASGTFYDKGLEGASHHAAHSQRQHDRQFAGGVAAARRPMRKTVRRLLRGPIWPP